MSIGTSFGITAKSTESETGAAGRQRRGQWMSYLLAFVAVVLVHGVVIAAKSTPMLEEKLVGSDGYMRLVLVTQLHETGNWFDRSIDRSNAPYGMESHWTRPMDVVLLAGGWLLSPWFGFEKGLFWWAVFVAPVLHVAMVVALIWAVAPLFDPLRRNLLILAILAQAPVLGAGLVHRADHHMLIILSFVVALGLNVRMFLRPFDARVAFAAGAALGFGLWLTIEGLFLIGAGFAAVTVSWLRHGRNLSKRNLQHALGLTAMIALAIVVERPPELYLLDQYGRISIAHLLVAILAAGFWMSVCIAERRGIAGQSALGRASHAACGVVVAGGVQFLLFPQFFAGSEIEFGPEFGPIFYDGIGELKSLAPTDLTGLGRFLVHLSPAIFAVPFLALLLVREYRSAKGEAWIFIAACIAVYLPMAIVMQRFAAFTDVLLAIVLAELLARLMISVDGMTATAARLPVRAAILVGLILGPVTLGAVALKSADAKVSGPSCPIEETFGLLNDSRQLGRRPLTILAHFDHGAELLYRTSHSVVASPYPYYRNGAGLLDSHAIFSANDDRSSRELIDRRGIDLVILCRTGPAPNWVSGAQDSTFVGRLLEGKVPSWLTRIHPKSGSTGEVLVFKVVG